MHNRFGEAPTSATSGYMPDATFIIARIKAASTVSASGLLRNPARPRVASAAPLPARSKIVVSLFETRGRVGKELFAYQRDDDARRTAVCSASAGWIRYLAGHHLGHFEPGGAGQPLAMIRGLDHSCAK